MLATGQALDAAAERRATKDLRALLDQVRTASSAPPMASRWSSWRRSGSTTCSSAREVLPVDGLVLSGGGAG
ncbi:MAG: hypothetical protein H6522_04310 [Mycolicibacterium sp.]|nr:hypothetical protein [Mycolicibacterium sp.]